MDERVGKKVILGMSGGVDSAYSANKLRGAGYEVIGAYLKMYMGADPAPAELSAEKLGIPFMVRDCTSIFAAHVEEYLISEYMNGRTPNPCVECNAEVKTKVLAELAKEYGADFFATGHYAKIKSENGRYYAACAVDTGKDQSYFLWRLSQERLAVMLAPLAELFKSDIKSAAEELGIVRRGLSESQEICFIGAGGYREFIQTRVPESGASAEGYFISPDGTVLGRHKGIINYTVGQRRNLGLSFGTPYEVVKIDAASNTVTIAPKGETGRRLIRLEKLNFMYMNPDNPDAALKLKAKIRYAARPVPCEAAFGVDGETAEIYFAEPVFAAAAGQSCVAYTTDADGCESVAFGGVICGD